MKITGKFFGIVICTMVIGCSLFFWASCETNDDSGGTISITNSSGAEVTVSIEYANRGLLVHDKIGDGATKNYDIKVNGVFQIYVNNVHDRDVFIEYGNTATVTIN